MTFLDGPEAPFDNNLDEQAIGPAAMIRKNRLGDRSGREADALAVVTSVEGTLQRRDHDPLKTVVDALANHLRAC